MDDILHEPVHWQEWREWSQRERQAILAEDWAALARCHEAKSRLQSQIAEGRGTLDCQHGPESAMAHELINLEKGNLELLNETRLRLQSQQEEFEASLRNLGRLRQSYAGSLRNGWQSYS
jgi:hypothetical protein